MDAQAEVRLDFDSKKQLKVVLDALRPEAEQAKTSRSDLRLNVDGMSLVLDFTATDTPALRAAVNSYLRLVGVAMNLHVFAE